MLTVRFEGRAVGIELDDGQSGYIAEIDNGVARSIDAMPGTRTVWMRNLTKGTHILRLIRRNETPETPGLVKRFLIEKGKWLSAPAPARRQIEFIGDSWTAAFGNTSKERECTPEEIRDRTDASQSFGVQVARHYNADWQLNAYSGMGMVRNWNGTHPERDFRTFYPRLLQNDPASRADDPRWKPQLIVIGLGTNDFSTPVALGEKWTRETLAKQYTLAYKEFIALLRKRNGNAQIILTAAYLPPDDPLRPLVKQIADEAHTTGDRRIAYLSWENLQLDGCLWHPSLDDHRNMADALIHAIDDLKIFP